MENNTKTPQQLEEEKKAKESGQGKPMEAGAPKTDEKPPVTEPKKS